MGQNISKQLNTCLKTKLSLLDEAFVRLSQIASLGGKKKRTRISNNNVFGSHISVIFPTVCSRRFTKFNTREALQRYNLIFQRLYGVVQWLTFSGEMSRFYRTGTDPGLSRQSTKSYKVVRQKSNAELSEKLRRLDREHHSTISKILTEKYTWRTIHYNLTHPSEESSSESDGENGPEDIAQCIAAAEEECQIAEKKVQATLIDSNKKQNFLQLPSIIEESSVISKQRSPKLGRSPLPPF